MPYIVAEPCIGVQDHGCVDACPVDCFYQAEDQLLIHPDECIDCRACIAECPVGAIYEVGSVPEQWKSYVTKNAAAFRVGAGLPKALAHDKWEAQRYVVGSPAYRYYEKYGKVAPILKPR